MATTRDYYEILGVSKNASDKELKSAYRKLALQWHPDKNKSPEAEKRFKEINESYAVLSDVKKKQAYDQFGHAAFNQGAGGGQNNPFSGGFPGGFSYTYRSNGGESQNPFEGMSDPFEIFEQFFGGTSPFGRTTRMPHYAISIDFMEAYKGVEKEFLIEGKKRKINIPAGVDDGSRIRFNDFFITVGVKLHKTFQRDGADVIANTELPLLTAITGGDLEVQTLDGKTKIKIRSGTQPNTLLRLSGQGMPRVNSRGRGDMYLRLQIQIPDYKNLSSEQKRSVENLK